MIEMYQQFIKKLLSARKAMNLEKSWIVYENPFSMIKDTREYIFIRSLSNWKELDDISNEDSISSILNEIYGEKEAMQWLTILQKAVKSTKTDVLSSIPNL